VDVPPKRFERKLFSSSNPEGSLSANLAESDLTLPDVLRKIPGMDRALVMKYFPPVFQTCADLVSSPDKKIAKEAFQTLIRLMELVFFFPFPPISKFHHFCFHPKRFSIFFFPSPSSFFP
jgi:hypothetical protein